MLPINPGRVRRPLPNYLKSLVPQWQRLFTSGKHFMKVVNHPRSGCLVKFNPRLGLAVAGEVRDSTAGLKKQSLFRRIVRRKLHLKNPQSS